VAVRVSLTEHVSIVAREGVVDEQRFPGRQGRFVFAYLLAAHERPVPRDELAEALWGEELPAKWEKALSVLVSKLRALLNECGVDGSMSLTSAFGCYQLTLPSGSWIDVVAADEAATAADRALAAGDLDEALTNASTASALARRTFLPGEDGRWVGERRAELREILVRALDCQAEANRLAGDAAASVRVTEELISLEPFRERGYRLLMQAQSAAGNDAEALRTYERCRTLLAEELGAFPSPETEAVFLEILRSPPKSTERTVDRLDDLERLPSPPVDGPPRNDRRSLAVGAAAAALALAATVGIVLVLTRGNAASPAVLPASVVRIDPKTLKPTQVVRIGPRADLVVAAGGYVWITHGVLRYTQSNTIRNAGDRTLTRVEPSTGAVAVVGGGLAPCGLAADPSGDVWVANCYELASGQAASVVRVDARTLLFKATWRVPGLGEPEQDYYRGLVYGGGSLWISRREGDPAAVTEVDPRTGRQKAIPLSRVAGALAWSGGYGDLWINNFDEGSITQLHAATGAMRVVDPHVSNPSHPIVDGDTVWAGDWEAPRVARLPAVGSAQARLISLPVTTRPAGVTSVATGNGYVWATVPDSHSLWRIDPKTNSATRIPLRFYPWGVAVDDDGGIWVTLRAHDVP
jgi:DNA-binding SARP family transcriptional activator/streptogramin lyase